MSISIPRFRLHRLISQWFSHGQVPVHGDPHECVDIDAEQCHLQVADQTTNQVAVNPLQKKMGRRK